MEEVEVRFVKKTHQPEPDRSLDDTASGNSMSDNNSSAPVQKSPALQKLSKSRKSSKSQKSPSSKSKKKRLRVLLFSLLLAIVITGGIAFFVLIKNKQIMINDIFVSNDSIRGVDISEYQGEVDMQRLYKQDIKFVYIKATEGSRYEDARFSENWQNAKESPLEAGAYHFFSFESEGKTQAENYIRTVGSLEGMLIPAVGVEYYQENTEQLPPREVIIRELKSFLNTLESAYGVKPIIYSEQNIYDQYLKDDFTSYPKWMRNVFYPLDWGYRDSWSIWQYSDRGILNGYHGDEKYIDLDVLSSNISLENLKVKTKKDT